MRIYFNNLDIFTKNAKRVLRAIKDLKLNDSEFKNCRDQVRLSHIQNALSIIYGYSSFNELRGELCAYSPQLEDLSNDQELDLEDKITEVFGELFHATGMRKDLAHALSAGVSFYLRYHCKDTQKKVKYQESYYGYKLLASDFGMTIPAFKKVLVDNGDLIGTIPTYQAVIKGRVKPMIVDYPDTAVGLKLVWSDKYIHKSFAKKGIRITSPYQWMQVPTSVYNAQKNLERLGTALWEIVDPDRFKNGPVDEFEGSMSDFQMRYLRLSAHPVTHWAVWESKAKRKTFLWDFMREMVEEARAVDPEETADIEAVIEKVIAWVEKYRGPYA